MLRVIGGRGLSQRIGGRSPFARRFLPTKHETGSVSTSKLGNEGGEVLASPSLWISDGSHWFGKFIDLHRRYAVVLPPNAEQLGNALPVGIICLQRLDPLDRIATS
jgi:hypothetical protein